jgi:tRNA(Arg) A34 adenosine deaminase TadA
MSSRLIEKLKRLALDSAQPETGRYRIAAAVLDRKGKILATGTNSYVKTHPRQAELAKKTGNSHRHWLHAEVAALVKVKNGIPAKIVVVRVGNAGELRLAKPCPVCMMAIKQAGIESIEYTV